MVGLLVFVTPFLASANPPCPYQECDGWNYLIHGRAGVLMIVIPLFLISVLVEAMVVRAFCKRGNIPRRLVWHDVLANVFSLPIAWFVVWEAFSVSGFWASLVAIELFAILFESSTLYFLNRRLVGWRWVAGVVIAANAASLLIGLVLQLMLKNGSGL